MPNKQFVQIWAYGHQNCSSETDEGGAGTDEEPPYLFGFDTTSGSLPSHKIGINFLAVSLTGHIARTPRPPRYRAGFYEIAYSQHACIEQQKFELKPLVIQTAIVSYLRV